MTNVQKLAKFFLVLLLANIFASPSFGQQTLDKSEVGKIIREYLLENPELILEVQQALEEKQQQELAISQLEIIASQKDEIFSAPYQIEIGNPNAEITIVEFFDYNCGFCQRALTDMEILLQSNENLKFVLKEFPVLGEGSIEATRVSMAFSKLLPEKHAEFHTELLSLPGAKDGNRAMQLAVQMGALQTEIMTEMENPEIIETIQRTYSLANGLGITGTPSYIVGNEVVFGAVGHDQLESKIKSLTQ
jgi:protein-disulfide isomerase